MRFMSIVAWVFALMSYGCSASSVYAASKHRQNQVLDIEAFRVLKGLSLAQCLSVCYGQEKCESFNYGNQECHLLDSFLCKGDPSRRLLDKPGYSYYDTLDFSDSEESRLSLKTCTEFGRCSSRCPKFRMLPEKKHLVESLSLCEQAGGFLAQPENLEDHRAITRLIQIAKLKSAWIGVQRLKTGDETFTFSEGGGPGVRSVPKGLWGDDQPNNTGGKQDCVEMLIEMKFKWNDVECNKNNAIVCQFAF